MRLAEIMDAINDTALLAGVVDRGYEWPTLDVNPPCLVVGYPTDVIYDVTMQRGSDRARFPVWIVCGKADARSSRDAVAVYLSDGAQSVKTALDGNLGGVVQSCRVTTTTFENVTIGGVDYIAAAFELDVLT